jgi:plastocyanin
MTVRQTAMAVVACLVLAACGGGSTTAAQPTTPPPTVPSTSPTPTVTAGCAPSGTELHVVSKGIKFDQSCLAAPADTKFKIEFENKDGAVRHNIVIQNDEQFLVGDPITGVDDITYKVDPIPAGMYTFYCQYHAGLMKGQFVVQ